MLFTFDALLAQFLSHSPGCVKVVESNPAPSWHCCRNWNSPYLLIRNSEPLSHLLIIHFLNGHPRPLFSFIYVFSISISISFQFWQQIYVKKCPSCIWHRDSNSQPLKHESPSITTRPGLLPPFSFIWRWKVVDRRVIADVQKFE